MLDGNEDQLALVKAAAKKHGPVFIIVDLMHVLDYLWRAGHGLYGESTPEAEAWVQGRLLELLRGKPAKAVAADLRRTIRGQTLHERVRPAVVGAAEYIRKYAPHMRYAEALSWGLPIATGVIEGACRYLVKDRMERGAALAGHLPEPRPSFACVRSALAATSMPIGRSTYERNSDATTPSTMPTPPSPIHCRLFDASNNPGFLRSMGAGPPWICLEAGLAAAFLSVQRG